MGFSSHEIYMILRARNEASGVLQRLARQLSKDHKNQMDRYKEQLAGFAAQNEGLRANSSNIMSNARVAAMAAREKIDAERGVIRGIQDRVSKYDTGFKKEMASLATAKAERMGYITMLGAESRELMRSNAVARENYRTQLDGIKGLRTANSDLYTQAATALRKNRDETIAANDAKRRAIGASIDELRKENVVIGENERRIVKNAGIYKTRANNSIKASQDIIRGHESEIAAIDRTAKKAVEANNVQIASNKKAMASVREEMDLHQQKLNRLEGLGQIYMMTGTAAVIAGGLMVSAFVNAGKAAADYQAAAALTFTQVDRDAQGHALVTQKAILDMGKRVAREWPVEFGSIQPALYDIFSSMDIASEQVAQNMVDNIAKAAVAGAVTMEVAGKGIIEVINAWKLPMTDAINKVTGLTESQTTLNRVNDVAFTLVKEGVGSYEQFSNSIGRSIPSAVKAGASYEDMAGGLAFLTRMGMSTAMASTSLGRAFDLISNPKFEANMKKYGMTTRDANGNFKSMVQITNDLKGHLDGMSEGQVADFLKKVTFGAGGTVQAMRFLNHAVLDGKGILDETTGALVGFVDEMDLDPSRIGLFEKLTADMYAAKGAADIAYETMANTPTAKIQEMSNQFDILKITIGETVLQAIVPIVEFITTLMDRFNMLSPEIQRVIVVVGMVAAGLLVFGGVVMLAAGFFLMLKAAAVAAAMKLSVVILIGGGIVAAFLAIIAVIVALVYFWPQISAAAAPVFDAVKGFIDSVVGAIQGFATNFMDALAKFQGPLSDIQTHFETVWNAIKAAIDSVINNPLMQAWGRDMAKLSGDIGAKLEGLKSSFMAFGEAVGNVFGAIVVVVAGFFTAVWSFLGPIIALVGGALVGAFMGLWSGVQIVFSGIITIATGVLDFFTGLFTGNWQLMADGLLGILDGMVLAIGGIFATLGGTVIGFVVGMVDGVIAFFTDMYMAVVGNSIVPDMVNGIIDWIAGLPGAVIAFIAGLVADAVNRFNEWKSSSDKSIKSLVDGAIKFISELPGRILKFITDMVTQGGIKFAQWATDAVKKSGELVSGAVDAISKMPGQVLKFITGLVADFLAKVLGWDNDTKSRFTNLVTNAVNVAAGMPGKVIGAVVGLAGQLASQGTAWLNSLLGSITSGFDGGVMGFVRGIPGKITGAFSGLGGSLASIGGNIMSSLAGGISSAAGRVAEAARNAASRALNAAKSFLGIASPSKRFMEIGLWSGEGLANGIYNMRNLVGDAGEALAKAAIHPVEIPITTSISTGSTTVGAMTASQLASIVSQNGASVVVNQEINTQEIDPVKHAADLGYEIGSRLGW